MVIAVHSRGFSRAAPEALRSWSVRVAVALMSLTLFAPVAAAQDSPLPRISFDGFGTVGVAHSTEDQADFVENPMRAEGVGYSNRFGEALDSRIGGQLTIQAGASLTGVVQVVLEPDVDGDYTPALEWANLRYSFTPDLSVRAGRIVLPMFMVSDARKVSFANPWIRPPVELYAMIPIHKWDGVDGTYRRPVGEWTSTLNAAVGTASSDIPGGRAEADLFATANASMVRGDFTGRVAIAAGDVTTDMFEPLFDGFRSFGPEGEAIADRYSPEGTILTFASAGMEYNPGAWFTMAEAGWLHSASAMGEKLGGYVTGGYRWGPLSPFVTFARVEALSERSAAGLSTDGMPAEYAQAAVQLNAGLNLALSGVPSQQTLGAGARWDVLPGMALKAQMDFIDLLGDSRGQFRNHQPTFEPGSTSQLFSVAATFVF